MKKERANKDMVTRVPADILMHWVQDNNRHADNLKGYFYWPSRFKVKRMYCYMWLKADVQHFFGLVKSWLTPLRLNCFKAANCSGLNCLGEWHLILGKFMLNHTEGVCVSSHSSYFTSSDPKNRAKIIWYRDGIWLYLVAMVTILFQFWGKNTFLCSCMLFLSLFYWKCRMWTWKLMHSYLMGCLVDGGYQKPSYIIHEIWYIQTLTEEATNNFPPV